MQLGGKKITSKSKILLVCCIFFIGELSSNSFAMSSPDDTIKPYVASSLLYDSNYLRISDDTNIALLTGGKSDKSDFIKQVKVGLDVDWIVSRQHFIVKAYANQNWFQNFSELDYLGWDTKAQWNWQVKSNLNGEIGYANTQQLGTFDYTNSLISNLNNSQHSFANAGYLFHPNGKIKFEVFRDENQFVGNDNNRESNKNIENNIALYLQYISPKLLRPSQSSLGLQVIATQGRYPNREFVPGSLADNAYTRMQYAMTWDWLASSNKTGIDGLIGYTQQEYSHLSDLNFSDIIGNLNLNWKTSDKLLLKLSLRRNINQYISQTSSFLLSQGVWMEPVWLVSPKISISLPMSYQQQQFLGNTVNSGIISEQRKDNVNGIAIDLKYQPLENISAKTILKYENRDSNYPLRSYEYLSAGIDLQVDF